MTVELVSLIRPVLRTVIFFICLTSLEVELGVPARCGDTRRTGTRQDVSRRDRCRPRRTT
jgi:hypothetical protein